MSAQVTEAHRKLVAAIIRDLSIDDGAQLIADSEARACAWALWAITCTHHTDKQRAECPVCLITALTSERGKLRAEVEEQCLLNGKGAEREADLLGRLERAEREVERLKSDGAASAFLNMACRASRAETDRNNLRADLDAIKAILTEEKARAERAEGEVKMLGVWREGVIEDAWAHKANLEGAIARAESAEREAFDWKKIARYEAARAERAEAELATERARLADLVADLSDACITLESAENDCDDYAMQNTAFKLMAVRNVFAAMKEGAK